jgi:hypothetical protein
MDNLASAECVPGDLEANGKCQSGDNSLDRELPDAGALP